MFVADELLELDEVASQGFDYLDPAHSAVKRRNLLIAADLADPYRDKDDLQRRAADLHELAQLRASAASTETKSTPPRITSFPEYCSLLADTLFPPRVGDTFFERELRSQFSEVLATECPPGVPVTVDGLIQRIREYIPSTVLDSSSGFRAAVEGRWHASQARIIEALRTAQQQGLKYIVTAREDP